MPTVPQDEKAKGAGKPQKAGWISFRCPEDLAVAVRVAAAQRRQTLQELCTVAIREYLARNPQRDALS